MKNNFERKLLGEVIKLEYGKALPKSKRKPGGLYPVYGANGEIDRSNEFYFDKKSIIVGRKGSAGAVNLSEEKFWPLDVTYYVDFDDEKYDLLFLYFLLNFLDLSKYAKGVKPGINRNELYEILVNIPSLPEQQRIVALLDKTFAAINTAQKNTEKNLQNARELFESFLENIFSIQSNDWKKGVLNEVCLINPPKNLARRKLANDDFVSFVPMSDLGINQKIFTAQKSRKFEEVIKNYTYFENDDVLLAKITPCFENGKLGIANKLINNIGFGSSEYIVFRPKQFINNEFLYYFLSRKNFRQEGSGMMFGAVGHKRVAKEFIENYIISFPKMSLQKEIVDKIDIFSYKTNETIKIFHEKLGNLEELKQSILHKAFVGEL